MSRILVIDDDPDIRSVMSLLLKKQGYEVETASRKEEIMDKISNFHPAVILLDVLLSGSDGRTICRELKEGALTRNIPVIIFSAHPGAGEKSKEYGADDFISKPFHMETLLTKLKLQLDKAKDII